MVRIRRAVMGTLAASVLVVGGLGVGNAWAQSDPDATETPSQSASSESWGSESRERDGDCPHDGAEGSDSASSTASPSE